MALDDNDKLFITQQVESINKTVEKVLNKSDNDEELVKKTESLAKISKRRDEVKEKLEGGQLKAKEAERLGIEHRVLEEAYDKLIESLLIASLNRKSNSNPV